MAGLLLLGAGWLHAGDPVKIWSGDDLAAIDAKLRETHPGAKIAGEPLGTFRSESCGLWRRSESGQAELHTVKTDLLIIEQGQATIRFGGRLQDPRTTAPNELRGPGIDNGETREVGPGSIIRIPAGTPHQFLLKKGQTVTYFAWKT